jgi:hypothetical protein
VTEFGGYIRANATSIPNYGERYRAGEAISSAFVESTVNQVVSKRLVKKQQMRWTPQGAHLLLQVRTRVLNDELTGVSGSGIPHSRPRPSHPRWRAWPRSLPHFRSLSSPTRSLTCIRPTSPTVSM